MYFISLRSSVIKTMTLDRKEKRGGSLAVLYKEGLRISSEWQHVQRPTHQDGHVLDLVFSRQEDNLVLGVSVEHQLSDHNAVHFEMNAAKPNPQRKKVSYRKLKDIDHTRFHDDLEVL